MAGGLFALLDDVAALVKAAAASVDDVATGAAKASAKSAGVIIDDAAVTPQYVNGISADRELGIIKRIASGSIKNKFLIIIPLALLLSEFASWTLPVLLIVGGSFLCFEGAEKVLGWLGINLHEAHHSTAVAEATGIPTSESSQASEDKLVGGAVRTDLVLSAEIMLIALSNIDTDSFVMRFFTLVVVALGMTVAVYGAVALIIRMDDFGLTLTKQESATVKKFGQGLVNFMPKLLAIISVIGTIAMLWVGGHLVTENLHHLHVDFLYHAVHFVTDAVHDFGGLIHWLTDTVLAAIVGLIAGLLVLTVVTGIIKLISKLKN